MDERRDDWHHGVDENLASLNAGQRVWERDSVSIRRHLNEIDRFIRGDPSKDTDGMVARLHQLENDINLLKAVVLKDKAGGKGLAGRVEDLEVGDKRSERKLKIWIAIIGVISATIVAAFSNLDRIEKFVNKKDNDPVHKAIERVKHPKRRHYIIRQVPAKPKPEPEPEAENEGMGL